MRTKSDVIVPTEIDASWRIGIVHSSFYKEEVASLIKSAQQALLEAGMQQGNITVHEAAGSFEVPLIGAALAKEEKVDALIGLGIIVEGDTEHARLIADAAAQGMMDVQTHYRTPFAFEILHVHSLDDARARSMKGEEAAHAVLHSLAQMRALQS